MGLNKLSFMETSSPFVEATCVVPIAFNTVSSNENCRGVELQPSLQIPSKVSIYLLQPSK